MSIGTEPNVPQAGGYSKQSPDLVGIGIYALTPRVRRDIPKPTKKNTYGNFYTRAQFLIIFLDQTYSTHTIRESHEQNQLNRKQKQKNNCVNISRRCCSERRCVYTQVNRTGDLEQTLYRQSVALHFFRCLYLFNHFIVPPLSFPLCLFRVVFYIFPPFHNSPPDDTRRLGCPRNSVNMAFYGIFNCILP